MKRYIRTKDGIKKVYNKMINKLYEFLEDELDLEKDD